MPVEKLSLDKFLELATLHPVLDVRSPGEYLQAHIPGAHSMPLFSDQERKVVGTAYKQQSREQAIKIGLDYYGVKMRGMVEQAEAIAGSDKTLLVHCWRGGMRSAAIAWLLDLYGFKVYTLAGGYKAFRTWVLAQFQKAYNFRVIGGYTGSGKTDVLQQLDQPKIDLEALAAHRGSAFGTIKDKEQPRPEMFENMLALQLTSYAGQQIWIEDESQRIGQINMPMAVWQQMHSAPVFFLDVPFEERLANIVKGYGKQDKEQLVNAVIRIRKRLGGLDAKNAVNYLMEDDIKGCFEILLRYYDKHYNKALDTRAPSLIQRISCATVDAKHNAKKLTDIPTNA